MKQLSTACAAIQVDNHACFFFQAEDGIRDLYVTGVQTCALPISCRTCWRVVQTLHSKMASSTVGRTSVTFFTSPSRSEEHTSELQSRRDLVCRLLLEKKKNRYYYRADPKLIPHMPRHLFRSIARL